MGVFTTERQARMDLTNAFRPGFEEAARRANTTFHPFNMPSASQVTSQSILNF